MDPDQRLTPVDLSTPNIISSSHAKQDETSPEPESSKHRVLYPVESYHRASLSIEAEKEDGGFGWVVVLGAFLVHMLIEARLYAMGILLPMLMRTFDENLSSASLVSSVFAASVLGSGLLCSAFDTGFGHIRTAFFGSLLATAATTACIWATQLWEVIIGYGLVTGIGLSMTYFVSTVAILDWFDHKRTLAMAIAVTGTGVGTFALSKGLAEPVQRDSWRVLMGILAGIAGFTCLVAFLFRQPPPPSVMMSVGTGTTPRKKSSHHFHLFDSLKNKDVTWTNKAKNALRALFPIAVFRNRAFMLYLISDFLIATSIFTPYNFLVLRIEQETDDTVTDVQAAWLPSILGIATIVGQLLTGLMSIPWVERSTSPVVVMSCAMVINGTAMCLSMLCKDFTTYASFCSVVGLVDGVIHTLTPIVCFDLAGDELFVAAWGLQLFLQGMGSFIGPLTGGLLIEYFKTSYWQTFVIFGSFMIFGGFILSFIQLPWCRPVGNRKETDSNSSLSRKSLYNFE